MPDFKLKKLPDIPINRTEKKKDNRNRPTDDRLFTHVHENNCTLIFQLSFSDQLFIDLFPSNTIYLRKLLNWKELANFGKSIAKEWEFLLVSFHDKHRYASAFQARHQAHWKHWVKCIPVVVAAISLMFELHKIEFRSPSPALWLQCSFLPQHVYSMIIKDALKKPSCYGVRPSFCLLMRNMVNCDICNCWEDMAACTVFCCGKD